MNFYRWHPAIKPRLFGPLVGNSPLHLQQSDLDRACGLHCALMALMLLGLVTRPQVEGLPTSRSKSLSSLWGKAAKNYFSGTNPKELKFALEPYARHIDCRVHRKNCVAHTLDTLRDAGTVIIGIETAHFEHWVLAIGVGGTERRSGFNPSSFLILDPAHSPIPLTAWNAMLEIKPDRQELHFYQTASRERELRVKFKDMLAIRPRSPS